VQHIVKYIYILFTFLLYIGTPTWAATDLVCELTEQNNGKEERWKCPRLSNGANIGATLSDLDVETGMYTCEYRYLDTQELATTCTYFSKKYKEVLDKKLSKVHSDVIDIITKGTKSITLLNDFFKDTIGTKHLLSFRVDQKYLDEEDLLRNLQTDIMNGLKNGDGSGGPATPDSLIKLRRAIFKFFISFTPT